jgi:hypothetical protein
MNSVMMAGVWAARRGEKQGVLVYGRYKFKESEVYSGERMSSIVYKSRRLTFCHAEGTRFPKMSHSFEVNAALAMLPASIFSLQD